MLKFLLITLVAYLAVGDEVFQPKAGTVGAVLEDLNARVAALVESNNIFKLFRDESLSVKHRLALPFSLITHFGMQFKDFNNYICIPILNEPTQDSLERQRVGVLRTHCNEDGTHWLFFKNDIEALGLNVEVKLTDYLEFFYGKTTLEDRMFAYKLYSTFDSMKHDKIMLYMILETIEQLVYDFFGEITKLGRRFHEETDIELQYLGDIHYEREIGHLFVDERKIRRLFTNVIVTEEQKETFAKISGVILDLVDKRWNLYYKYAVETYKDQNIWDFSETVQPPSTKKAKEAGCAHPDLIMG